MKHKMKRTAGFLAVLCVIGSQSIFAQGTRKITLKEAIDLGITNSHLLKNNKARIDEAVAAVREANERKLPDFSVSGSFLYLPVQPSINLKTDSAGKGAGSPTITHAVYGIANASVPIYTAGKVKYGIESAKYLEQAARLDADDNREAVILNIINAYSNLYKSGSTVNLVRENLEESNLRVKDFANLK